MKHFTLLFLLLWPASAMPLNLRPGFDKAEFRDMLMISSRWAVKPEYYKDLPDPSGYRKLYRSQAMGLHNCWELWINEKGTAVVSIRGTTGTAASWFANFYSAMVPAKGYLQLSKSDTFSYDLASNPRAAVHVGWLLCTAYLSNDILPRMDSLYRTGTRDFIVTGHSQGGGIAYLMSAYLYGLQRSGRLPSDIRFKTYCSAAPKPGNLYFAYDFEETTHKGWAYNVVNTADWVPETPFTIQTMQDLNETNPFSDIDILVGNMKWKQKLVFRFAYHKLNNPTIKARDRYIRLLGEKMSEYVKKFLPDFILPAYYAGNDYVRTGATIVLQADSTYYSVFPSQSKNVFVHHFHKPYLFLLDRYDP